MREKSLLRLALAITAMLLAVLATREAKAWKPITHQYFAKQVLNDLNRDCTVRIEHNVGTRSDPKFILLGRYDADPEVCAAVKRYPEYYMAGVCGPDCDPDVITGQALIHPHAAKSISTPWGASAKGTDAWLSSIYMTMQTTRFTGAKKQKIIAYVHGFLTHAAGDMFAHTFVNSFADGPFTLARSNILRHSIIEAYVAKRTPKHGYGNAASISGIEDFLYTALIQRPSSKALRSKLMHVLEDPGEFIGAPALSVPHILTRIQAKVREYNCINCESKRARYSRALFLLQQPGISRNTRNLKLHFKNWDSNITAALLDWVTTGHKIAEPLALGKKGTSLRTANDAFESWKTKHMCKILGVNRKLCGTLRDFKILMDRLAALFEFNLFKQLKEKALKAICQAGLGMTCQQWIAIQTDPETWFDDVIATRARNGDKGCIGDNQFQQNVRNGKRRCISRVSFDRDILKLKRSRVRRRAPITFSSRNFAPGFNTVQLSKMVVMSKTSINKMLRDLVQKDRSSATSTPRAKQALINGYTLKTPNIMLGWLSSIDAARQWCLEPPHGNDKNQRFSNQVKSRRLFLPSKGGNLAFNSLFRLHSGIHPKDDCNRQRLPIRTVRPPHPSDNNSICVLGGTQVAMADGSTKSIELVKAGDRVHVYDTEASVSTIATVTETFTHPNTSEYIMVNGDLLGATGYHQVYADGQWVRADELTAGSSLLHLPDTYTSNEVTPMGATTVRSATMTAGDGVSTYNLAVDGPANFFANGVLVKSE